MVQWTVPLADVRFDPADVEAVAAVYRSGWLSQGEQVEAFEHEFAAWAGCSHAVAVSSGTAALQLIMAALALGPGDEVVMPSLTFAATAAAVWHTGARIVFADIAGLNEPWLSADAAAAGLSPRTRVILNVAYAGHPGQTRALQALAASHGIDLIEDAAHGLGANDDGRRVGTIGRAGAFSFFANKNLPLGEGGMLVTGDAGLAGRARLLRSHGLSASTWERHHGDAPEYEVMMPGFNFRLDEPRAALGRRLLRRLDMNVARRRQLAQAYGAALAELPGVTPALPTTDGASSAWHIYPIVLGESIDRDDFRRRLGVAGIQTSVHYPPLHTSQAYREVENRLPLTEAYAARTVTLPLFPHMTDSQLASVCKAVETALDCAKPRL